MGLRYRVRIPRGIATRWAEIHKRPGLPAWRDEADPGVTFRAADLGDGRVPRESTVADEPEAGAKDVGLDGPSRDEAMATIAAAERSLQPDRLPLLIVLVIALVAAVFSSGILQGAFSDAKERLIEERIRRPRAGMSWRHRHGVTRAELGLPPRPSATPKRGKASP